MSPRVFFRLFLVPLLALAVPAAARAQTGVLTVLHSFSLSGGDPGQPYGPVAVASDGSIYGVTYYGGTNNLGEVYQLAPDRTLADVHDFGGGNNNAATPESGLIDGGDGYFYGTSDTGGSQDIGAAYKVSTTGAYLTLHSFTLADSPVLTAPLFKGSDGYFYGTTVGGGHDYGSAFRLDSTGTNVDFLYNFNATDAATTTGGLVEASNGYFYGVAIKGDGSTQTEIYRVKPGATATVPIATVPTTLGIYAAGGLVDGGDGFLYGANILGGANYGGTLYKVSYDGTDVESFYIFGNNNDPYDPETPLIKASDGNFYGVTNSTVYQITPAGAMTTLVTFNTSINGQSPQGALVEDPANPLTFYGVNENGGPGGYGVLYKVVVTPRPSMPVITSATTANGQKGVAFSYQITATNAPTSYDAAPLPAGLSVDPTTGIISGAPTFAGTTDITLSATNAGGTGTAILALTVMSAAAVQPTVAITSPPDGITLVAGTSVPLAAAVTDPDGVLAQVQFLVDGLPVGATTAAGPYVFNATVPPLPGTYTLTAVATDTLGRQNTASITVTILAADPANPPPVADLLTPLDGRNILAGSPLTLTAGASASGAGLDHVNFYADGALIASLDASGNPITMTARRPGSIVRKDATPLTPEGSVFQASYTMPAADKLVNLIAVAFDKLGQSTVSSVATPHSTVTSDQAFLVVLGGLSNGAHVNVGSTTAVTVTATPPVSSSLMGAGATSSRQDASGYGVLSKMENLVNNTLISILTGPPFNFSFSPPAAGVYVLHSVVTDASGLATISDPVVVHADALPPVVTVAVAGDGMAVADGEAGKVAVRRTGDTSAALSVRYKLAGSAKAGVDYKALAGSVIIPAGAAQTKLKLKPIDNPMEEGTPVAKVKLLPSLDGSYLLGTATVAKIKIIDGD